MKTRRHSTADTFARNLGLLIERNRLSQAELAKKSSVSQKSISNMIRGEQTPTLETLEKISAAFGVDGWQLVVPELPLELIGSPAASLLLKHFTQSSKSGRDLICRLAEREATHNKG